MEPGHRRDGINYGSYPRWIVTDGTSSTEHSVSEPIGDGISVPLNGRAANLAHRFHTITFRKKRLGICAENNAGSDYAPKYNYIDAYISDEIIEY